MPSAFLPPLALAHLGHPVLWDALIATKACHSCKQTLHFQCALMLLKAVTWSGDRGWFILASQNCATCGAFLASVLCWQIAWPEQKGQPAPWVLLLIFASQTWGRLSGHCLHDHHTLWWLLGLMTRLPRCMLRSSCHCACSCFASRLMVGPTCLGCAFNGCCQLSSKAVSAD